ncbi:hypothetical protein SLUN_37705 [Streptomyces lunaelactis]|uniref:Uncharacterized protein n=1 Tax=Streptomyces lunaelactis TaxID=1535768 RepID=A0A2R4TD65_9ACTN|nr:hypothetical protein [Streptomyces lunaelactis]AVZ77054.1 hypothetical protein SLUN_37705 [Streptomyces lunaelactis]NUK13412.1 hypothetical protein [Streptomyces lunaelactis]NUK36387.1 hypothetical protein [Streptomyces lunaelactis]NUK42864.1 hypothetical protein [Streptomyces lunaelactis]NUK52364.1 hypothetical protein [Streptomyces lunaelactis]
MANPAIRVRLKQGASESDVGALKAWLEREHRLEQLRTNGDLEIKQRAGTEEHGAPMSAAWEILLVLIGAVGSTVFVEVLAQVKSGVRAWQDNRRSVEHGEPPEVEVIPDRDAR